MSAAADKPLLLTGPKRAPQPRQTSNRPAACRCPNYLRGICLAWMSIVKDSFASPMAFAVAWMTVTVLGWVVAWVVKSGIGTCTSLRRNGND